MKVIGEEINFNFYPDLKVEKEMKNGLGRQNLSILSAKNRDKTS